MSTELRESIAEGWSDDFANLLDREHQALKALLGCRVPTVAGVNGAAAGTGATLALLTDLRVVGSQPGSSRSPLDCVTS